MGSRRLRTTIASFLLAAAAVLAPLGANAQERGADEDVPAPSRVYIPFEDLKQVFEKEGQGVFVPYAEFQALWRKAMDRGTGETAPSGVSTALYEGRVEGDLALIDATLEVQARAAGESAVPIGLAGATIGAATLDDQPAVIVSRPRGHSVIVSGTGPHTLKLTLVAAVTPQDGDRTVAFPSAGAPVSRLSFAVPGEGVKVTVSPNLATTRTDAGSGITRVLAYVGAAPQIRLTWRPKPMDAVGAEAILQAQTEILYRLGEQTVETHVAATFSILRGGMRTFRVRFPAGERVLRVGGVGIRSWEESDVSGAREVKVELHNDAEGDYALQLLLERPRPADEATAALPTITFPGSSREAGTVAVQVLPPIAVRPATVAGHYRVPTDSIIDWMRNPPSPGAVTVLAWRFAGSERSLSVAVETVAPEVSVAERSILEIAPGAIILHASLDLVVERAGLFQTAVSLPEGFELESAQLREGNALRTLDAREDGEGAERRVLLDLGARRSGLVPLLIKLRRAFTLGEAEETLSIPVLDVEGAARARGVVAVAAQESLDVRTAEVKGFVPAEPQVLGSSGLPGRPTVFGFQHAGEERSATLTVVRRKPQVTAEAVTVAGVEEDRLQLRHTLRFSVRYAGVDTFRFSLPKAVTERVRIEGAAIKEKSNADDPDDAERTIHTVILQTPALGQTLLTVEYDIPDEPLAIGASRKLTVPSLRVLEVERDQGWYAVTRDPALSVGGDGKGLTYADAREVPAWAGAGDAFLAWRRLAHPHSLTLNVAKHEPVPILQAVVNALALDTLVGGGRVALTEARMDVQVNGLQYLRVELPEGARIESAEVDGQPVAPRMEQQALLLPVPPGKGRDDRFGVRLVYSQDAADAAGEWFSVDLVAPRVPDALVQATAWTTWVPPDVALFSGGGNLRPAERSQVFAAVLDSLGRVFGVRREAGRPTTRGGALPPEVTLSVSGRAAFSFQRTGEDAHLTARYLPRIATGGLAALAAIVLLGAGWVLSRRGLAGGLVALVAVLVSLALFPSAAPGVRPALAAIIVAAVVLAILTGIRAERRRARAAREARIAEARDAYDARDASTPVPPPPGVAAAPAAPPKKSDTASPPTSAPKPQTPPASETDDPDAGTNKKPGSDAEPTDDPATDTGDDTGEVQS